MVENKLEIILETLRQYYHKNHLKPNPSKTQVCTFHLRNKQANKKIKVKWHGEILEYWETPTFLDMTLDRTLTYKNHSKKTLKKVNRRNGIIRKLIGSKWRATNPLCISAMVLCFSTAEYACPEWRNSVHTKKVDVATN